MKKNLFLGLFLMICVSAFGQVSEADADKAFKIEGNCLVAEISANEKITLTN
jgi:hypothetical protein